MRVNNLRKKNIMKKEMKKIIYGILLILGLLIFILQLFIFEAPDGVLGFIICLTSIYMIFGSIIGLCKVSEKFKNIVFGILEVLFFWIP